MAKSYTASNTALASGLHAALNEFEFIVGTAGVQTVVTSITKGTSQLAYLFTTAENRPNDPDWPSGAYTLAIDCTAVGADITYGVRAVGTANGHFARVTGALGAESQTWTDSQSAFSGTGVKNATTGTVDPTAGVNTDRWEALIAANNAAAHTNETFDLDLNESDDASTGAWRDSWTSTPTTDTVAVSDSAAANKQGAASRSAADTCAVSDSASRLLFKTIQVGAADTVAVADAVKRPTDTNRKPADTPVLTDAVQRETNLVRTIGESVAKSDAVARTLSLERAKADTLAVSDAVTGIVPGEHAAADDTASLTDAATRSATFSRIPSPVVQTLFYRTWSS